MLDRIIKKRIYEQFYENNRGYYEKIAMDTAKKRGVRVDGDYLVLWHATSKKNHQKILKQGKLLTGTFFADTDDGARFWGERNLNNNYVLMQCYVHKAGVLPHGEFWVANGDLKLVNHTFWHPKEVTESKQMISEVRVAMGDLATSMKVIKDSMGSKIEYRLMDTETDKMVGNIEIKDNGHSFEVSGVAAYLGFGATMYEIAMMDNFPKGLTPDRDGNTSDEAMAVWEKFYQRGDVIKKENPQWMNIYDESEKNFLVNIIYSVKPTSDFQNLEFISVDEEEMLRLRKKGSGFDTKMKRIRGIR